MDAAAATPLRSEVLVAMNAASQFFGNPASLHMEGKMALSALEQARTSISSAIGASSVYRTLFTSGGTESCNLAVQGTIAAWKNAHPQETPHIICSAIEHSAVIASVQRSGAEVSWISPDEQGVVHAGDVLAAVKETTVLVIVMMTNNETGMHQPIHEIGKALYKEKQVYPVLFTDACAALGSIQLHADALHIGLVAISASKIGGPKGIGVLCVRESIPFLGVQVGGGQERGLRSGTENVTGAVGFAAAVEQLSVAEAIQKSEHHGTYFEKELIKAVQDVVVFGAEAGPKKKSSIIYVQFPHIDAESFVLYMDAKGISVGTGAACDTQKKSGSHVLAAMGKSTDGAIRFSFLPQVTKQEIDFVIYTIQEVLAILQA